MKCKCKAEMQQIGEQHIETEHEYEHFDIYWCEKCGRVVKDGNHGLPWWFEHKLLPQPESCKEEADSLECHASKTSLPETETYLHHGGWVRVQKHLKGKHRQHCLCMQGCIKFKPGTKENCDKADLLYAFCRAFNMTTPVWECPNYATEEIYMD